MAMGVVEIATIARTQDYTKIKHNENTKVATEQSNIVVQNQKETLQKGKQVVDSKQPDWHNKKFDAKEKGKNEYTGSGGGKRKKHEVSDGKVKIKKEPGGFDVKI